MVELIVNNEGLDLGEAEVLVSFQVNDIGQLETRQGDFSFEFELPGTQKNRRLLNRPEGINANPYNRIPCTIKNGNELKRGFLQVMIFEGLIRTNFFAGNTNWMTLLGESLLSDLDLSDLNHAWTEANVSGSFANVNGYIYPYMDIDGNITANLETIAHTDLYPAVFVSTILERIFQGITHKIGGDLLSTPDYKRLILPFVKTNFSNPTDYYTQRSIFMGLAIAETNIDFSVHWSDDTPPFYNSDLYSQAFGQYTANGDYTLNLDTSVDITAAACFPVTVSIRKNAVNLVNQVLGAPGVATLSTSDQATLGDIYDVYVLTGGVGCPATAGTASWMSFIAQQSLDDGDEIEMSNTLAEMKQLDLIKYIAVSFGIIPTYDEYSQTVSFNMFKSLKQNPAEDWSDKYIPKDYELDFFEFIGDYSKLNYLRYAEAEETGLIDYRSQNGQGYGDGTIGVNNDFVTGISDMYDTEFIPTWFEAVFDGVRTANISTYTRDDKPRILLCVPDTTVSDFAGFVTVNVGATPVTEIAWAYFAKYKLGTGMDAITLNLSYDNPNILNVNGEGLTDKYWMDYESILQEPIMLKAMFKLSSSDILNLDYTRLKYIEGKNITGYWFLNRIEGYDFSSKKVKCELVKIATRPTSSEFTLEPPDVPFLEWWFDNSDASKFSLTGPLVDSQADSGPNGYTRSAVGGERPTLAGIEVIFGGAQLFDLNQLGTMLSFDRGEFFYVVKSDNAGANTISYLSATKGTDIIITNTVQMRVYESAGAFNNSIGIFLGDAGPTTQVYGDDSLENDITYHILNWRSDGSNYGLSIDGVEQNVNGGTDNGRWYSDVTGLDIFTFAAIRNNLGASYEDITDKESMYFREQLSAENRAAMITYLKDKHGL